MNKQQADYCDNLSSGNIEVAVPHKGSMTLRDLRDYCFLFFTEGVESWEPRDYSSALDISVKVVNDILTGLGK